MLKLSAALPLHPDPLPPHHAFTCRNDHFIGVSYLVDARRNTAHRQYVPFFISFFSRPLAGSPLSWIAINLPCDLSNSLTSGGRYLRHHIVYYPHPPFVVPPRVSLLPRLLPMIAVSMSDQPLRQDPSHLHFLNSPVPRPSVR
jgi:hypothetical protein